MQEYAGISTAMTEAEYGSPVKGATGIHSASMQIAKGLAELGEVADGLRDRLDPILRPSEPHPMLADTAERRPSSSHTTELVKHANYVRELVQRLRDIQDRLDV